MTSHACSVQRTGGSDGPPQKHELLILVCKQGREGVTHLVGHRTGATAHTWVGSTVVAPAFPATCLS